MTLLRPAVDLRRTPLARDAGLAALLPAAGRGERCMTPGPTPAMGIAGADGVNSCLLLAIGWARTT
ncbi:MAG: hypothetical protein ETSY2_22610 [Candidatus Entotheonella gemina]|uniref:Uncharacterized protein n=1 Tax=Candidatus Entotheonella gemina TaxID=1429439 RepID=W4M6D8_9BACT|nr:MAG: hypothetical protein ETSY2_22610 [Candidatus Entotheonella gemina]